MKNRTLDLNNLTIKQVKLLNDIHEELKEDYHELIEKIYNQTDGSIDWLVNSLLSRHNYLSNVYLDLCYLELIKRMAGKENVNNVIVKSPGQKKALKEYFYRKKINISVSISVSAFYFLKIYQISFYNFLKNIQTIGLLLFLRNSKRRKRHPKDIHITLIDTFFVSSMFKDGIYKDRYYPGILKYLNDVKKKTVFFVPTLIIRKKLKGIIKIAEQTTEQFLFKFDYLKVSDYIFALLSPFRIKRIKLSNFKFRGFYIGPILRSDFYNNITDTSSFEGLLNYRFFRRLKEQGVKLRLVIDWFENQVIDRGFNKGKNEFYPDVKSIGYEGFIVSYDYNFYMQPSLCEYKAGVLPDHIAVIGNGIVNEMKKYLSEISVARAPSFRFESIHKYNLPSSRPNNRSLVILVTLPISKRQSRDILELLIEYNEHEKNLSAQLLVKPHPALNMDQLRSSLSYWPEEFRIVDGNFSEIIPMVDLMMGNASSTCIESLAYGIPVIVVGSQNNITQNPIPDSIPKTMWKLCYTADEFNDAVKILCDDANKKKRIEYIEIARRILEDYFEPVTRESVMKFLNLDEETEGVYV